MNPDAFRTLASYRGDTAGNAPKIAEFFFPPDCLRERPELIEIFRGNSRDDGQKARRGAILAQPVAADLAAFDRPTLLLAGSEDRLIPNTETFAIARDLKARRDPCDRTGRPCVVDPGAGTCRGGDDRISEFVKDGTDNTQGETMADQTSAVAFDEAPVTTRYWLSIILFAVTGVVDFFDFFVVGFLVSVLAPKWHLTFGQTSIMLMSAGIGAMLGALAAGFLADRFGRKPLAVTGVLICGFSSGAIALIPEDGWIFFACLRFFVGFGLAAGAAAGVPAIVEFAPTRHRTLITSSGGRARLLWRVVGLDHRELPAAAGRLARACRGRLPADHPGGSDRDHHAGVAALADQQRSRQGSADQYPQTLSGRRSAVCAAGASGREPSAVRRSVRRTAALLADGADLVWRQHGQLRRVPVGTDDRRTVARPWRPRMRRRCSSMSALPACSAAPVLPFWRIGSAASHVVN